MADAAIGVRPAAIGDVEHDLERIVAMDVVEKRYGGAQQLGDVDWFCVLAGELGIEPRSVGNVADQPIEPPHVVLDNLHQPLLGVGGLGERQGLRRAAQGCERVL